MFAMALATSFSTRLQPCAVTVSKCDYQATHLAATNVCQGAGNSIQLEVTTMGFLLLLLGIYMYVISIVGFAGLASLTGLSGLERARRTRRRPC